MNSLVKAFSNFKEFYNEINGATLTGAIDVIVVEQPNGDYQCSPFHVRFGKLGVLRSREKVVDIEINGEPVDIHMKLGESGEAFFVEELADEDVEELPDNLATSPIPTSGFPSKYTDELIDDENSDEGRKNASDNLHQLPLPLPRRNSIDFSKDTTKETDTETKFENQVSDYSHRRHTDNTLERRNLGEKLKEYTTMKIRQEWAEHEEIFQFDPIDKDKDWSNSTQNEDKQTKDKDKPNENDNKKENDIGNKSDKDKDKEKLLENEQKDKFDMKILEQNEQIPIEADKTLINIKKDLAEITKDSTLVENTETISLDTKQQDTNTNNIKEESKSKKKRRKKSQMKKKNAQRKSSSSSSVGSNTPLDGTNEASSSLAANQNPEDNESNSVSISNNTLTTSNEEHSAVKSVEQQSAALLTANCDDSPISETCQTSPITPSTRIPDLDIHFFSDTEVTTSCGIGPLGNLRGGGRPSSPIQSDSELEISMRGKENDNDLMSNSASWKWGELPTPEHSDGKDGAGGQLNGQSQAQRNSMLSGMFNFMKKTNKIRQQADAAGGIYLSELDSINMDPEMAALYFPNATISKEASPASAALPEDDRESGNGTSLPHSPSSLEGQKSIDSDYEDGGKPNEGKYLDFVAMSLCGVNEKGDPSDEEFDRHLVKYSDVCENPTIFSSPNLVVRLNGKYYSWAAACPIVMTIITFHKPLTNDALDQITAAANKDAAAAMKSQVDGNNASGASAGQLKRSWWNWRRTQNGPQVPNVNLKPPGQIPTIVKNEKVDEKDGDNTAVATTQTTRPNSPDFSENTLSKTDSTINAENTSAMVENLEDLSQSSSKTEPLSSSSTQNQLVKNERYKKSLRLSSDVIKKLKLNDGMNEVEFSVTTAYQGTTRCKCYLFKWKHNDKVVISDIDGTITKSDVLGHILPMVGKDWAQMGVAQLFSKIEQNGYKLLYLSARAIGQSKATREYLRSIRQGDVKLPDGPLLLNPTSLISAFHREVIERKPEEFKIACLSDIKVLFPNKDPFYAGYGNRINDVWAYRAVGIPIMRIFTINTKGELKHELTQTFQSSGYINQSLVVDKHFPPLGSEDYEYESDLFDDDQEEDELQFSGSTDSESEENENYSDDYADDGIIVDEEQENTITNEILFTKHSPHDKAIDLIHKSQI